MPTKLKLEGNEYEFDSLSETGKEQFESLRFVISRIQELNNMQALLQRAKNSYVESLKREMLSDKAGILFEED